MARHSRQHSRRSTGFTLIEVLVALTLVSVLLTGLLALTRSTLGFVGLTSSIAKSVGDVSVAEGYVADTIRSAKAIYGGGVVVEAAATSTSFTCSPSLEATGDPPIADGDCIFLLVPVVAHAAAGQPIVNFDAVVLRIEQIGSRFSTEGVPRGWNGTSTLALFEYREADLCSSPCATPPTVAGTAGTPFVMTGPPGLVLQGLSAEAPTAADPTVLDDVDIFEVVGGNSMEVTFVTRADSRDAQPYTVRQIPLSLDVSIRGLSN